MAQKRARSLSPKPGPAQGLPEAQYFKSAPIEDRQSTFIAIFSPAVSGRDLQRHSDFKKADHKMVATRKASSQQTLGSSGKRIYNNWSDDDSEKYAGKQLERVLTELDVEGAVVVARWYGGVLLGPVRFEHIKTAARDAIRNWMESQREAEGLQVKKAKLEDGEVEKNRLAKQLKERDESIIVLRKLFTDKSMPPSQPSDAEGKPESKNTTSPAKQLNYEDMPLARLKQLDKARDASIGFLLKQLDAAEVSKKENVSSNSPD